ncbi:hypothetical protein COP2_044852 [Malus domestica]|uniref:Uncharacterized protein n=1 Tax=Malus domestica TaxID=3750 RepID=A0A498J8C8_MALDO|nr:hypothetical protein DVH24_021062 [Malus domestica]
MKGKAEVQIWIQKKLQVPDEEFSKWKFAFLPLGRPEYLQDSDIVSRRFQRRIFCCMGEVPCVGAPRTGQECRQGR